MCGPAKAAHDEFADFKTFCVGSDDLAYGAAFHFAINGDVGGVGFCVIHAAAHIGVQRHVVDAHEDFAFGRCWDRCLFKAEVGEGGGAVGAAGEDDLFHCL